MQSNFTEMVRFGDNQRVVIYRGISRGLSFFAYILCSYQGLKKMNRDYDTNAKVTFLSEYGEVLYIDVLQDPDEKAQNFLKEWQAKKQCA